MRRSIFAPLILAAACSPKSTPAAVSPAAPVAPPAAPSSGPAVLGQLHEGEHVRGFSVRAVYTDDAGAPIGARFVHDQTGFTVDYVRIESAPQAHLWVTTYPTSDKGEPHTQEHLLLGKGNRGRRLGSNEAMALVTSSAYTEQWRTSYTFKTVAGPDAYWGELADHLDALLNPDYTDEEIRREVRNFGVDKAADGTLRLEEKGTVYNEMVGYYESPEAVAGRALGQLVYGATHPLAMDSGGYPAAIRTMTPADIRAFHTAHYHLANMGMIGAYPSTMPLDAVLARTGEILAKAAGRTGKVFTEADLPKPAGAAAGTSLVADYPFGDTANPSPIMLEWPATRQLDLAERTLAGLFLDAFAGDSSTPIYHALVDSKTRVLDLGATGVSASISADEGQPIQLELAGVRSDKLDVATIGQVRDVIARELDKIAKLPDGDPALVAFDRQVQSRVVALRRHLAKLLDTPPGFGERNEDSTWMMHLYELGRAPGFVKSLTLHATLAELDALLAKRENPWRTRIHAWGLDGVPYGVAARPSPQLRKQLDAERDQRIAAELARLASKYGTKDAAATLARYAADYDRATHELEAQAQAVQLPPLVASPPMTLDDSLQYETGEAHDIRTFRAHVDSMASMRVQLAFSVAHVAAPDELFYLAALPVVMREAGVIEDGKPISAAEMEERLRKEILDLSVYYVGNPRTHRTELVVSGAGNGPTETRAALAWMGRVMHAPDLRPENVSRLLDVLAQTETELRQLTLGYEEHWVDDPRDAWAEQDAVEAHARSMFTELHDLHRIRWQLSDPHDAKVLAEVQGFLGKLAGAKSLKRTELVELAAALAEQRAAKSPAAKRITDAVAALSPPARALAQLAGKDLATTLGDLPDDSLARDWDYLCREMSKDVGVGATRALGELAGMIALVAQPANARLVEIGSAANEQVVAGDVDALLAGIHAAPHAGAPGAAPKGVLAARLAEREPAAKRGATFVGLVDPSMSSGVFLNLAPAPWYGSADEASVVDYLASNLYTGHGGHSIYAKTWAAGLAYSNGLHPHVHDGLIDYYAERCPLLPQTIRFVIDQLKAQKPDANIARYAIANAFDSRIADAFERRASDMAADLVDGIPPDLVRAFRSRVLELAKRADLADVLYARMPDVYGKVLPGLTKLDPAATYFVIGPEKQLAAYDEYLRATIGKTAHLFRIYPRDFWIPAKI
ncbi:MAG TPA: hypothetical protein VGG74_11265 [Kofleriaceae bacterium]